MMGKRILLYGLASGILLVLLFMVLFKAVGNVCENYGVIPMWGYGFMVLAFLFAVPAAFHYQKRSGKAGFVKTFGVALVVCLIGAFIFSIYGFIQFDTPDSEDLEVYSGCEVLEFDYAGMGKAAIGLEFVRFGSLDMNVGNSFAQAGMLFLTTLVVAVLVSLGATIIATNINYPATKYDAQY